MRPMRNLLLVLLLLPCLGVRAEAPDPFSPIEETAGLPRVLLIGDSISMGYTLPVRELLSGRANVHRIPENGASTLTGLEKLEDWLGAETWDVIHFNWGLHDLKHEQEGRADKALPCQVPLEAYEQNLETLVRRLKVTGARLVWASTTVVPEGEPRRVAEELAGYNAAAARVMARHEVPINDLHAVSVGECAALRTAPNNVHFTEEGSAILARHVARHIEDALAARVQP